MSSSNFVFDVVVLGMRLDPGGNLHVTTREVLWEGGVDSELQCEASLPPGAFWRITRVEVFDRNNRPRGASDDELTVRSPDSAYVNLSRQPSGEVTIFLTVGPPGEGSGRPVRQMGDPPAGS